MGQQNEDRTMLTLTKVGVWVGILGLLAAVIIGAIQILGSKQSPPPPTVTKETVIIREKAGTQPTQTGSIPSRASSVKDNVQPSETSRATATPKRATETSAETSKTETSSAIDPQAQTPQPGGSSTPGTEGQTTPSTETPGTGTSTTKPVGGIVLRRPPIKYIPAGALRINPHIILNATAIKPLPPKP